MSHFLCPRLKVSFLLRQSESAVLDLPAQLRLMLLSALPECRIQKLVDGGRGNVYRCIDPIHLAQCDG